jgi:hypothetical protein
MRAYQFGHFAAFASIFCSGFKKKKDTLTIYVNLEYLCSYLDYLREHDFLWR